MTDQELEPVVKSLKRVQDFDVAQLPRRSELGEKFSFDEVVPDAQRTISLFRKVPLSILEDFPASQRTKLQQQADAFYNQLESVLSFDPELQDQKQRRQQLVDQIEQSYQTAFGQIHTFIAYAVSQTVDFNRLETEGQAALQGIIDRTASAVKHLENVKQETDDILSEVRRSAADIGVSKQAIYFHDESESHLDTAKYWSYAVFGWAAALMLYGVGSLFLHKWSYLAPSTASDAAVLIASKLLIFGVLSYMLILSARNFLSHKHNAVVNKHRQNALQTFNALVAAGSTDNTQDIVLSHASACIFSPQDTGYIRNGGSPSASNQIPIEFLTRAATKID